FDTVIFFHEVADEAARDHFRSNVDDARLDKGVFRDGMRAPKIEPLIADVCRDEGDRYDGTPDGPSERTRLRRGWPRCRRRGCWGGRRRRWRLGLISRHDASLG